MCPPAHCGVAACRSDRSLRGIPAGGHKRTDRRVGAPESEAMPGRIKHGESSTSKHGPTVEYRIWNSMINRCERKTHVGYRWYGARGIRVCERWRKDYQNFLADMGRRPASGLSLDRIDRDGNYELANCRWATWVEQAENRPNISKVTHNGVTKSIPAWARSAGLSPNTLWGRINRGWAMERALAEPAQRRKRQ